MKWVWKESKEKEKFWKKPEFFVELKFLAFVASNEDQNQCDHVDVSKFPSVEYSFVLRINCPKIEVGNLWI